MAHSSVGRPAGRPAWNAGTRVRRVNILENLREMTGLADAAAWRICDTAASKGLGAPSPGAVTELLRAWGDGDDDALEQLMPLVEAELRRLARGYMATRAARAHAADNGVGQ